MDPLTPQDQNQTPNPEPTQEGAAAHIDLNKVLLPKKETPGHTPDSAERVNAGELLAQEQAAAAPTPAKEPVAAPAPLIDEDVVKPLETYQRDIESVVQDKNVSVLSIASAEAERRSKSGLDEDLATPAEKRSTMLRNILFVGGGLLLLIVSSGALAYLVTRTTALPPAADNLATVPFISVDGAKTITITADESRDTVMANLNAARQATSLSLGLISALAVTESSSTPSGDVVVPLGVQDFFNLIAPDAPAPLGRSIGGYLLGVHVYDGNQPFIIAHVDSYEDAYAAMLKWEPYLQKDLSPLFDYTPTTHIPEEGLASTTQPQGVNTFAQSNFADKIIENEDARALVNSYGDVYLLWTFLDRNTLVITTNDATLREIISRRKNAPVTPIPGSE